MKTIKKHPVLWLAVVMMLFMSLLTGPAFSQCTMTAASLDAALAQCTGDDIGCYAAAAQKNQSCAGNIAWYYMMVYTPDDPQLVLNKFSDVLDYEYLEDLANVVGQANQVIEEARRTGASTTQNEYRYGQVYGQ